MQDQLLPDDVLLNTAQVAQMLQVSPYYVVKHSTQGAKPTIPFVKLSHRTLRFKLSSVQEFIASRTKRG
jgi:predicted DNA-binding transcriptional regulator AlpA